jgi:hypothetical protein
MTLRCSVGRGVGTADLSTTLRSGRDDNSVAAKISYFSLENAEFHLEQNCHPTEAYPDFLPRSTGNDRVCGFQ